MIGYDDVRKTYFVLIEYRDQNGKRLQKKNAVLQLREKHVRGKTKHMISYAET